MEIRALLFDVNGTLIDIETDEWMEETYRAIAHFLTYQGIALHRGEVRELYFQIMKEQFAASAEIYREVSGSVRDARWPVLLSSFRVRRSI
jgi:putative hydrolase of the HAD superfamily